MRIVLLAAGESRRFGKENKLLADFQGKPLLCKALETLKSVDAREYLAVVSDACVEKLAQAYGFKTVWNAETKLGLSHSIALGIQAAEEEDDVLLSAADMPKLSKASLERLIGEFERTGAKAVCLSDGEVWGNPAVFSKECRKELLSLTGDRGAKRILVQNDAIRVLCAASGELTDTDTPQALKKLEETNEIGEQVSKTE